MTAEPPVPLSLTVDQYLLVRSELARGLRACGDRGRRREIGEVLGRVERAIRTTKEKGIQE